MNNRTAYMRKQILNLVWPALLEGLGFMLIGVVTTAMAGRFGPVCLSAVALAMLVQSACAIVFTAAGTGAGALVARNAGAGKWDRVREIAGQALLIGVLTGSLLGLAGYALAEFILTFTGAEPEVSTLAGHLLRIIFLFSPCFLIMSIGNSVLRFMGRIRLVFYLSSMNSLLTVAVCGALIFGWCGLSPMQVYGAAWGLGLGQSMGAFLAIATLAIHRQVRLRPRHIFCWRSEALRAIVHIALPASLEQASLQGGRMVFTFMLASAGAVQFAAHQIANQVESISFMPGYGFSIASMALVGLSMGQGRSRQAQRYIDMTVKIALLTMGCTGALFLIFSRELAGLFISDPAVITWGSWCVMVAAFEQPTLALTYVYSGALRGAGDTRYPFYITTAGVWLFRLPLVYLLIVQWQWPIVWAWVITCIDFALRAGVFYWRYHQNKWKEIQIS